MAKPGAPRLKGKVVGRVGAVFKQLPRTFVLLVLVERLQSLVEAVDELFPNFALLVFSRGC